MKPPSPFRQRIASWGRNLVALMVNGIYAVVQFFVRIPYRRIAHNTVHFLGNVLHVLLFKYLLPKKYRTLSKKEIYTIIFKSDTPAGKQFDIWLIVLIFFNIVLIMVESLPWFHEHLHWVLVALQWACTLIFTFEYYLRIYCLQHPMKYIFSFYGIIDFLSIFPAYLSLIFPATQTLSVLRILRSMRVFRVLKLQRFMQESSILLNALRRSLYKILMFMFYIFLAAVLLGAIVYMFEKEVNPAFVSIPRAIYWAVVTLTTVGYGDITPMTFAGRFISVVIMILGYSVIAILTGIVTSEAVQASRTSYDRRNATASPANAAAAPPDADPGDVSGEYEEAAAVPALPSPTPAPLPKYCPHCGYEDNAEAMYCRLCGTRLETEKKHGWLKDFFGKPTDTK